MENFRKVKMMGIKIQNYISKYLAKDIKDVTNDFFFQSFEFGRTIFYCPNNGIISNTLLCKNIKQGFLGLIIQTYMIIFNFILIINNSCINYIKYHAHKKCKAQELNVNNNIIINIFKILVIIFTKFVSKIGT